MARERHHGADGSSGYKRTVYRKVRVVHDVDGDVFTKRENGEDQTELDGIENKICSHRFLSLQTEPPGFGRSADFLNFYVFLFLCTSIRRAF